VGERGFILANDYGPTAEALSPYRKALSVNVANYGNVRKKDFAAKKSQKAKARSRVPSRQLPPLGA
jgi:hypothetical protein